MAGQLLTLSCFSESISKTPVQLHQSNTVLLSTDPDKTKMFNSAVSTFFISTTTNCTFPISFFAHMFSTSSDCLTSTYWSSSAYNPSKRPFFFFMEGHIHRKQNKKITKYLTAFRIIDCRRQISHVNSKCCKQMDTKRTGKRKAF